jgi:hypothetical protein
VSPPARPPNRTEVPHRIIHIAYSYIINIVHNDTLNDYLQ